MDTQGAMKEAGGMVGRDRSLAWRVAAAVGATVLKTVGFFLSVVKPPEQMNAQTMLPPEAFPARRDEYRP